MSFQQFPPAGDPNASFGATPPVVQQPAAPFAPDAPGGRRTGLIAAGALVLAAGIATGVVMFVASGQHYDEAVQNLARAPVGCTTSLEFADAGTFIVYVETVGTIGEVRGDCPNTDDDYEFRGDDLPDVDVVLVDESGDEVDLDDFDGTDYDAAGFVGTAIATVDIEEPGDFEITVTSDDDDFVIAIGKDPKDSANTLRTNGLIAAIAGLVLGGLLLVLGLRRKGSPPAPPAPPAPSYGYPPAGMTMQPPPAAAPPTAPVWPPAPPVQPPPAPAPGPASWPAPPNP